VRDPWHVRDLPAGTVTFLFTDIEGSTKLLQELHDDYAAALAEHRRLLRRVFPRHGGVEVDTQGDAFFVAFARASNAVSAAEEAQAALAEGPIRIRIGLHTGEPAVTEEGYVGLDVHRAARICAVAHGGQVVLSQSTRELVDAEIRDLGLDRLKDLQAPERLYQLGNGDFPPIRSLAQTNLPIQPTPFLGREDELSEILDLLRRDDVRLLTLTGPGGVGKTRLALQAAAELTDEFADGVVWAPLAALREPQLVRESLARVVGGGDPATQIGDKRLLVLFDNFEQVVEAADAVGELLARCAQLKLLVTSREPLRLSAEHEYPVSPLVRREAVDFFLARARAVKPGFQADGAADEICRRLDNLPLALELAAARVKVLAPHQILERLAKRLPLLTGGARDAPERQRALRKTIEWSYELLGEEERRLFRRLSVFVGFTLEAAEEVADADLDQLQSLVDKSLVGQTGERFWMLETIREFAREQLEESGEAESQRRRQAEYAAAFAPQTGWDARASRPGAIERLEAEYDNILAAFEWALANDEARLCERLVEGLWFYWVTRGMAAEGSRRASAALERSTSPSPIFLDLVAELARFSGDLRRSVKLKERSIATYEAEGDDVRLATALTDLAETLVELSELERAQETAERALAIRTQLGNAVGMAHARAALVRLELRRGNHKRAVALSEESIPVWRERKAWGDLGWECVLAGTAYRRAGEAAQATERLREGVQLGADLREHSLEAAGVEQVAALAAEAGDFEDALRLYGAARAWRESSGYAFEVDDTALTLSAARFEDEPREALLAEGSGWELEDGVRRSLEYLD